MPRARTPVAKAKATGAEVKNPARHAGRAVPKGMPILGAPSDWMNEFEVKAFELFKAELPWLKESHRVLVELASTFRARLIEPGSVMGLQAMQELRRCLAQLGATPADESKIVMGNGDEEDEEDSLFSQPAAGARPN